VRVRARSGPARLQPQVDGKPSSLPPLILPKESPAGAHFVHAGALCQRQQNDFLRVVCVGAASDLGIGEDPPCLHNPETRNINSRIPKQPSSKTKPPRMPPRGSKWTAWPKNSPENPAKLKSSSTRIGQFSQNKDSSGIRADGRLSYSLLWVP
jgi:hypothetical protein